MSGSNVPAPGEKLPEMKIGPFDASDIARYAKVSSDENPLHLDDALAKSVGLAAPPVHGMKLLAHFDGYLAAWRPDLTVVKLGGKFVQPILRGEGAVLSGRVIRASREEGVFLRLFVHGSSRAPAVIAEAALRFPPESGK